MPLREGVDMGKRECEMLRSALASTRMEGYTITTHTEKDCARLLRGEVTTEEIVREILAR